MDIAKMLDQAISDLEARLSQLQAARIKLAARSVGVGKPPAVRRARQFTAAQRAEISRRMKATWAARRKAKQA
jgi:hypothetical protein